MKNLQICYFCILASFSAFILTSCERPPETEKTSDNKVVTEKSPLETTASEIAWDYSNNSMTADNKFKDTTFNVSGTIVHVKKNSMNEPYVSLKGGVNPEKEPQFAFVIGDRVKAYELKVDQKIKLQCKGLGDLGGAPAAGECKILE